MKTYNREFYQFLAATSGLTAEKLVPLLIDWFKPNSVIDVGCGVGSWAAEFNKRGVREIHGVDGNWVPRGKLLIPAESFAVVNLTSPPQPTRRFDLGVCLEVGEHLPEKSARLLVDYLCALTDVIVFSAAIPGQGGTLHLNEQWPDYWAALFGENGYCAKDVLRPILFRSAAKDYWYSQNSVLFIKRSELGRIETNIPSEVDDWKLTRVVHPRLLRKSVSMQRIWPRRWLAYTLTRLIPDLFCRLLGRKYKSTAKEIALYQSIAHTPDR